MAQTIKRTVSIDYQAKGLKEIQKQVNSMELFAGDSDTIKQLKREAAEFAAILAKQDLGAMDPATAEQMSKKYANLLKLQEKGRLEIMKLVDEDSALSIGSLNEQIELQQKLYNLRSATVEKINSDYQEKDGRFYAGTKKVQKETLDEAGKNVLTPSDQMLSPTGYKLRSPDSFIKGMTQVDEILGRVNTQNAELNKKLREGQDLTEEEVKELDKYIIKAREKGEVIKLNSTQLVSQSKIRKNIEDEQQKILEKSRDAVLGNAEDEKEAAKVKLISLEQEKKRTEDLATTHEDMSDREKQALSLTKQLAESNITLTAEQQRQLKKWKEEQKAATRATKDDTKAKQANNTTMGKAINQIFNYGVAFSVLRRVYNETLRTIKDLDAALTEMAVVTSMSREEAWELVPALQNIAKETGFASTEIAKLSTVYFRQGRALNEVIELTTVAAKAARIAGISAQESADYLTSAVNGFGLAAEQALSVSDKFAALAASSASSYEELATGLSKFAAQANIAGMSIDFALGMLAKGVETTREAPETIGTALKTVIARMRELTDLGKTFEDGMNVNRVETALRQVGVQLIDTNGQFRDMQAVLTDVGNAWETLNTNQRASVAVALAGTRQQSRLIAIMNDFDRTLELVNISQYSQGATTAQHMEYMKSMEAATVNLQNAWQKFVTTITNSETIIGVIKLVTKTIDGLSSVLEKTGFIGRNLFTIILSLVLGIKAYNVATGIAIKLGIIEQNQKINLITLLTAKNALGFKEIWQQRTKNRLTLKAILLDKLHLKQLWINLKAVTIGIAKWTAYWIAAMGPVGWAIAAMAGLGIAIGVVSKAREREIKKLKEERAELQKNIYEVNKFSKDLGKLSDQIEEINNKPIKVEADYDELESLIEQVKQIEEEKGIKLLVERFGEVEYEATLINLQDYNKKQKQIMKKNMRDLIDNNIKLYENSEATLKELSSSFADSIIYTYENINGQMTQEQRKFFDNYINEQVKSDKERIKEASDSSEEIQRIYDEYYRNSISELVNFNELYLQISSEASFSRRLIAFREQMALIEDEDLKEAFASMFPELAFASENFGKNFSEEFDDLMAIIGTSYEDLNEFWSTLEKENFDPMDFIEEINNRANELMDYNPDLSINEAIAMSFADIAREIDNATIKNLLYEKASSKTMLSVAQEMDRLDSVIKNINDTQDKFLRGEMSQADMFKFIEDNPDIFEQEGMIENFLNGEDITSSVIMQKAKEYENYEREIIAINSELEELKDKTDAESLARKNSLRTYRAQILSAMQYSGILKGLSETQYEYNNILQAYNRASELGVDNVALTTRMLDLLNRKTSETLNTSADAITDLKEKLTSDLGDSWTSYIQIVDGVAVINTETYRKLSIDGREFVDNFINNFNSEQDALYESFKELRDVTLAEEKKAAEKKKKIYEDYFAALDRMEAQRERSQSREDLVAQLQRLEGATDEKSRQRAKEIRKELNQLDKDAAKDAQEQSRQAMIDSIDEGIIKIEEKFANVWEEFLEAGTGAGDALFASLKDHGLLDDTGAIKFTPIVPFEDYTETDENVPPVNLPSLDPELLAKEDYENRQRMAYDDYDEWFSSIDPGGDRMRAYDSGEVDRKKEEIYNKYDIEDFFGEYPGYSNGGMVDYTGLAMVHGSSSKPEAFLNARQTEMFAALTGALSKISVSGGKSESISIENITIQTNQLNNKQDFDAAGKTLAQAFSSAIKKRGISVNTRK